MISKINSRVLGPLEFSGSIHGDYGYEIDGIRSTRSYATMTGAKSAMYRALYKMYNTNQS